MKKLTLKHAKELVVKIDKIKDDDEVAHEEEDKLRAWFIESCANGLYDEKESQEISKIVLSTKHIKFSRWCA